MTPNLIETEEINLAPRLPARCLRQNIWVYHVYNNKRYCATCIREAIPENATGSVRSIYHQHGIFLLPTRQERYCAHCQNTEILRSTPVDTCLHCRNIVDHFYAARTTRQKSHIHWELAEVQPISYFRSGINFIPQ